MECYVCDIYSDLLKTVSVDNICKSRVLMGLAPMRYFTIIPRARVGYEMTNSQRGA